MSQSKPSGRRTLMSRRWVRSAVLLVVVAAAGTCAGLTVLEDDASEPPTAPTHGAPGPKGPRDGLPVVKVPFMPPPRRPISTPPDVAAEQAELKKHLAERNARRLARAKRPDGVEEPRPAPAREAAPPPNSTPAERVSALRDLEQRDKAAATVTAMRLVHDPAPLVRANAVAVLARNPSPAGDRVLASLDAESRQLALAVAERR